MKVFVDPIPATLSRAMFRVANALEKYAPPNITIVKDPAQADLQVMHTISIDVDQAIKAKEYVIIQYCLASAFGTNEQWHKLWRGSRLVWSYYDLDVPSGVRFFYAPLGVDGDVFKSADGVRDVGLMTSGYVSGPGAEAIEECAVAAYETGLKTVHLGPPTIVGMKRLKTDRWTAIEGIDDLTLAKYYQRTRWVSGLRHVEGFELPVLEGLACGARPIVFDRHDMRAWYQGLAVFVPECSGPELVGLLREVFLSGVFPVTEGERRRVVEDFNWQTIVTNFWNEVL